MTSPVSVFHSDRVACELMGPIACVRMTRSDKMNGLDLPMFQDLISCARRLRTEADVRAVVLSGDGPAFCAGLDFKAVAASKTMIPRLLIKWPWSKTNMAQRIAMVWRELPMPVIAVVHGCCFGGGLQMALAADFRFAETRTRFSVMEMKWGLIPDMSILASLTALTRQDIAKELAMTGREFNATEAQQWGLITAVSDDPMTEAMTMAERLSKQSPDAVAGVKRLFNRGWHLGDRAALRLERWIQYGLLGRKNQQIAMRNGLAGKEAEPRPFRPRSR